MADYAMTFDVPGRCGQGDRVLKVATARDRIEFRFDGYLTSLDPAEAAMLAAIFADAARAATIGHTLESF